MLTPFVTFAGPICFTPSTEKGEFILLAILYGVLFVLSWILVGIFTLIFHLRKTLHSGRKSTLRLMLATQLTTLSMVALGSFFGGTDSVESYCTEPVSTPLGQTLTFLSVIFFAASTISSIVFVFYFKKKQPRP